MSKTRLKSLIAMALATLLMTSLSASKKKRDWREGTWRSSDRLSDTRGAVAAGTGIIFVKRTSQQFLIETVDDEYLVEQRLKSRQKPLPMTVNGTARFVIEKDDVYVLGEDGKEYKLGLLKKTLKQPR